MMCCATGRWHSDALLVWRMLFLIGNMWFGSAVSSAGLGHLSVMICRRDDWDGLYVRRAMIDAAFMAAPMQFEPVAVCHPLHARNSGIFFIFVAVCHLQGSLWTAVCYGDRSAFHFSSAEMCCF